jgi:hypothetical protein
MNNNSAFRLFGAQNPFTTFDSLIYRSSLSLPRLSFKYIRNQCRKLSVPSIESNENIKHAVVSTFDLFSIGVGPSSSHTVGPMRAAKIYVEDLFELGVLSKVVSVRVDLYGSLALTGRGHGTPSAILMGLEGETAEGVDTFSIGSRVEKIEQTSELFLRGQC